MKTFAFLLFIFQLVSCVSTSNVAESRNREYAAENYFELFKFWQEMDILRFKNDILKVKILLVPEGMTVTNFESDSQMVYIYDSLRVMIEEKMEGFREFKNIYMDTTDQARMKLYHSLKSDSTDLEFLSNISDSPYFELYEDILTRLRKSIQTSKFYSSPEEFETYIQNRSIEMIDENISEEIIQTDSLYLNKLSKIQIEKLRQKMIDFLIAFSGSYNIDYSDRARGRIGSESILIKLFDIKTSTTVTTGKITTYWGNE
jgi:hypothetical protein